MLIGPAAQLFVNKYGPGGPYLALYLPINIGLGAQYFNQ